MNDKNNEKKETKASPYKSLLVGLLVLLVMVVYAYGFEITKVNLAELRSEKRQESLLRVTRALAQPDIIEYEQEVQIVNAPLYVPCPEGGVPELPAPDTSGPYIVITPACGEPGTTLTVEGFGFFSNAEGPLRFVPDSDPENPVSLGNDSAQTDGEGHFVSTLTLANRPSEDVQFARVTIRRSIGTPRFTQTAKDTWEKIIETVFLALLATTLGTALAIPLSFLAARNLMKPVRSPIASIALSIIGWPLGMAIGLLVVQFVSRVSDPVVSNLAVNIISVVATPLVFIFGIRWALPETDIQSPPLWLRLVRGLVLILVVLVSIFGLLQLAALVATIGNALSSVLGPFAFIGNFMFQVSEILRVITPAVGALAAGGALGSFLGRIGQRSSERLSAPTVKILNLILMTVAGAVVFGLLGALVEWLYQIGRLLYTLWIPVAVGAGLGFFLALFTKAKTTLPTGLVIYTVTRTLLNGFRSIEALVMAIVFVIAVGIGPFAGVLALGLHTIVSLGKLYSEQVESIMPGPLEAIEATGANRLQTIIYGVVPQIVPPYISYTMYRWDINVRMSTIIGFVGGGGIGFLLQQNINLLNYRAASAQMLAIAVVVASMDYISSVLREKYV